MLQHFTGLSRKYKCASHESHDVRINIRLLIILPSAATSVYVCMCKLSLFVVFFFLLKYGKQIQQERTRHRDWNEKNIIWIKLPKSPAGRIRWRVNVCFRMFELNISPHVHINAMVLWKTIVMFCNVCSSFHCFVKKKEINKWMNE